MEDDCLFIPAYYFYQYFGKADKFIPPKNNTRTSTLAVVLKYE